MRWRRITQESLLDGLGIWIDYRLKSYQPFLSPIVPEVSVVAYLGLECRETLSVGNGVSSQVNGLAQGFREECAETACHSIK